MYELSLDEKIWCHLLIQGHHLRYLQNPLEIQGGSDFHMAFYLNGIIATVCGGWNADNSLKLPSKVGRGAESQFFADFLNGFFGSCEKKTRFSDADAITIGNWRKSGCVSKSIVKSGFTFMAERG